VEEQPPPGNRSLKNKCKSKHVNLLAKIADAVNSGRYMISSHAFQRSKDRLVPVPHVEHVLLNGFHESRKDRFESIYGSWNYAIRGSTPDRVKIRVIVAFSDDDLLVVTVINLDQ
jgi:hypothetical protein